MRTATEDLPPLTLSLQRNTKDYRLCAEIHSNKFTRVLFLWMFSSFHPVNYSFSGRVRDVNTGQILQKYTPVCADVRK